MKKLLIVSAVILMCAGNIFAQDSTTMKGKKMHHTEQAGKKMKDCVMMDEGKMWVMKGGKTTEMTKEMTMTNGTKVMTDGSVKMKDGKTTMMKDGDCIMMSGKMKKKDGGM
ncbi:hypothetical protein SAMN05518672_101102 [Chitinophaga sp. CF118]|uniref:DUF6799 domain-containing protein n=1 Tax=Chitinophaga sp. CF118 TaxID=1884367 RepID=UPI0008EAE584|nr:DUF6799 domain-containing protein [Chitinophaga sp. CF118]SFD02590.1 hypothetical protein SAMN05518672_101102 [Chitinophaga sp. CF118]